MKTIQKILVPIDFSENSYNVIQQAANFAKFNHAQIILLHVYNRPLLILSSKCKLRKNHVVQHVDKALLKWREKRIAAKFDALLKDISNVYDTRFTIIRSRGLLTKKIKEVIKRYGVDMVISGINRSKNYKYRWSNKIAKLTNKIKIPVLILPHDREIKKSIKLAFAYDLKEIRDLEKLNIIKIISSFYNAEINIFTVSEEKYLSKQEMQKMEMIKEFFEGYSPEIHVVRHPDIEEGIRHYLHSYKISLLAVLRRSRNMVRDMFHKSISKSMASKCDVPVLSIEEQ